VADPATRIAGEVATMRVQERLLQDDQPLTRGECALLLGALLTLTASIASFMAL
jgi:hypothetical protein